MAATHMTTHQLKNPVESQTCYALLHAELLHNHHMKILPRGAPLRTNTEDIRKLNFREIYHNIHIAKYCSDELWLME
ncbi:hypothetical protein SK128_011569 [Halocaridina rubra]|uniref:Uncharacterized protein n=1 Tax=Halocaridina rubra TaxID=373956 RepID=A0AAN8X5Q8_HALRR